MHFRQTGSLNAKTILTWLLIVAVVPSCLPLLASPPRRNMRSDPRSTGVSPREKHDTHDQLSSKKRERPSTHFIENYGKLPLSFEVNKGQVDPAVKFFARGVGYGIFLTQQGLVMELPTADKSAIAEAWIEHRPRKETTLPRVVTMKLQGGNLRPTVTGLEELPGKSNYFIGNNPKQWRTDVPSYAKVKYADVYPGVDMVYYGNNGQLEYDFVVAPGADPKSIKLNFDGVERLSLDENGDLLLSNRDKVLRQHKPVMFQEIAGSRHIVESSYRILDQRQVTFAVGEFERDKPLIIDPVLTYSTLLGGNGDDRLSDIAVDSAGNVYVVGHTQSTNFPRVNPYQNTYGGVQDIFVTKINAAGTARVYSTYIGGSSWEYGNAITIDASGVAYVVGESWSNNFPTVSAFQAAHSSIADAVMFKLSAAGNTLLYSTYLGGSANDIAYSVAVDTTGAVYVGGQSQSTNFPVANAFQSTLGGGTCGSQTCYDAFVTKFNPAGSALVYSTYLGGNDDDTGQIMLASSGAVYITGFTFSANFPKVNPLQGTIGGNRDVFVAQLNPAGNALVFSTYIGGSGDDVASGAAIDSAGNVYVTGSTQSINFPTVNPIQSTLADSQDAFVFKLSASGNALIYSTYLGGWHINSSSTENGRDIAVDNVGNAYVTGNIDSDNFPLVDSFYTGFTDGVFVSQIDPSGSTLLFSTAIGGDGFDFGNAIALGSAGEIYVGGDTSATNFPLAAPIQATHGGGSSPYPFDAFVLKIGTENGFSISGQISDPGSNPISGVRVTLAGRQTGFTYTDATGFYSFPHLLTGNYTLTPSKSFVTFSPTFQTINNLTSNQTANFTGTVANVTLNGKVKDANGAGVSGVTVSLTGSQTGSQLTDAQGNYTFANLSAGGSYTLTPSRNADTFTPANKSFTNLSSNQTVDFTLIYKISGQITDSLGAPASGVTITLSGAHTGSILTDVNGNYNFLNLPANASYTVTPSKPGYTLTYTFTPASQTFATLNVNAVANFSFTTSTTFSVYPVADAHVQDGTGTATNFGAVTPMLLKTANQADQRYDVYLRFDLSAASRKITSAKLRIFAALSAAGSVSTSAYSVSDVTWSETGITWTNKPARNATAISGATTTVTSTSYATYDLDITAYVLSEKSAGRDVISIALHDPANSTPNISLNSREAVANKPQLILTTLDTNNSAPTVSVTSPANNASFNAPATVPLSASASDSDGSISKVDYYAGNSLIGTATVSPFNASWANVGAGSYSITAVATDNQGLTSPSTGTQITVSNGNIPPTVTVTAPQNGTTFPAGANTTLAATASDIDGSITQVEFFSNSTSLGIDTTAPYSVNWNNMAAGAYSITARATDDAGSIIPSIPVTVNVVWQTGYLPVADASVKDSNPTTNFGTATDLQVQQGASGSNRESHLRFDLTSVTGITRARLRVYGALSDTNSTNIGVGVYSVASTTWTESGSGSITWNNKPAAGASPLATTIVTNNVPGWYEMDVSSYVQAEKTAGHNLVGLALKIQAASSSFMSFNSREATTNRPQLIIWTTQTRNALFVVGSSNLNAGDTSAKTRLESLGFTVTVKVANNQMTTADADGKALIAISSTSNASSVTNKFRHVAVPIVNWEFDVLDDLGMTGTVSGTDFGTSSTAQTQLSITNSTHPMAAGLSGTVSVVSSSSNFSWGMPNANAAKIASLTSDANKSVIFGYASGAAMPGLEAPTRRVSLFMTDLTANSFNSNGTALFDAAVKWASEFITAPTINSLTPGSGPVATSVTISGYNFRQTQGTSTVTFNEVAASPSSWNDKVIIVPVPAFASTGLVVVKVNGVASNGVLFTVGDIDSDGDGLADWWELQYFGNLNQTASGDPDGDGLTNIQEFQQQRNPTVSALIDDAAVNLKVFTPLASPTP